MGLPTWVKWAYRERMKWLIGVAAAAVLAVGGVAVASTGGGEPAQVEVRPAARELKQPPPVTIVPTPTVPPTELAAEPEPVVEPVPSEPVTDPAPAAEPSEPQPEPEPEPRSICDSDLRPEWCRLMTGQPPVPEPPPPAP